MDLEELLHAAGIGDADLADAAGGGAAALQGMVAARLAFPGPRRYTAAEVQDKTGVAREEADRLWLAMGFPLVSPDEPAFTDADVEALSTAKQLFARAGIDDALALQLTRTMSRAVAQIASALQDVVAPSAGDEDVASLAARAVPLVEEALPALDQLLVYLFRRHLSAVAEQLVLAGVGSPDETVTIVGFADLVGFTVLSQELTEKELADLIDGFSAKAMDVVADAGGRVIKMIGDEIMFSATAATAAADIALALIEDVDIGAERAALRVGLAGGRVLSLQGDLFGAPVNLASRLVDFARPATAVVDTVVYQQLEGDERYVVKAIRPHRLKGFGTTPTYVLRRPPSS